jgi:hypothetical protein
VRVLLLEPPQHPVRDTGPQGPAHAAGPAAAAAPAAAAGALLPLPALLEQPPRHLPRLPPLARLVRPQLPLLLAVPLLNKGLPGGGPGAGLLNPGGLLHFLLLLLLPCPALNPLEPQPDLLHQRAAHKTVLLGLAHAVKVVSVLLLLVCNCCCRRRRLCAAVSASAL